MRGGTWNMLGNRDNDSAARTAWSILASENLDFLALNESGEYLEALRMLAPPGGSVFESPKGRRGSCSLITAPGVKAERYLDPQMTTHGWYTVRGTLTGPKYACSVAVGWLRVTVVHYPPSVWARGWANAPWRRARAYRQHSIALRDFIGAHRHRHFAVGDWNATPSNFGLWSPRWLSKQITGRMIAPATPTHGRRIIDFAVTRGVKGRASTRGKFGSDHSAVVFTIDAD